MNESSKQSRDWRFFTMWALYGGLSVLLVLIVTGALAQIISPQLATRLAYNSEAYLFVLVLGAWVQFGLAKIRVSARLWASLAHGAVWAGVGVGLLLSGWPSRIVTLNETAFALAVLIPYVAIRRPLPRWSFVVIPVLLGLTIWAVGWSPQSWVIDQAETFGFVVLTIATLDVFDRVLLQPDASVRRGLRWAWYGFLVLEPIVVSALGTDIRSGDSLRAITLEYLGRVHESFIGVLLLSLVLHLASAHRPHVDGYAELRPSDEVRVR